MRSCNLDSDHRVALSLFKSWVVKQLTTMSAILL